MVDQFLIVLNETDPLVWRRIQVPHEYSFWDLHVAIQDAMGWLDYHLHEFLVVHPARGRLDRIGIPGEEFMRETPPKPGWKVPIAEYFRAGHPPAGYLYDVGDDWSHTVIYEGTHSAIAGERTPRCLAGERAGPPEDCGGVRGFAEFLRVIADPRHPEHESTLEWVGGRYDGTTFSPGKVGFADPKQRWDKAFRDP